MIALSYANTNSFQIPIYTLLKQNSSTNMGSFGEKVVQKLGKCIPDSDVQTFKALSVKCLREGGPSGLQKLKDGMKTLPDLPSQDLVKEIEDIFNDYTINTLSFVFQNKQVSTFTQLILPIEG